MREKLKALEKLLRSCACRLWGLSMGPAEGECDIFLCGKMRKKVSVLKDKPEPPTVASE
jgi:hypothetical protein